MVRHTDAPNKSLILGILFKPIKRDYKAILNIGLNSFFLMSSFPHVEGLEFRLTTFR